MVQPVDYSREINVDGILANDGSEIIRDVDEPDATAEDDDNLHIVERNPNVSHIGGALYRAFIQQEFQRRNIPEPHDILHNNNYNSLNIDLYHIERQLQTLSEEFSQSPLRDWVSDQAARVPLNTLNFDSFSDLLYGLFQEGGVTWERIIVLFYFCADLSVRASRENLTQQSRDIIDWTFRFMTGERMLGWIADHGGWARVMEKPLLERYKPQLFWIFSLGFICIGFCFCRKMFLRTN